MNVYEEAHNLKRAIEESEEYKQFKAVNDKVQANEELKKMIDDFQAKQFELQAKQMSGEELGPEILEGAQKMAQILMADPVAADYMNCSMRLSIMVEDVSKIIMEPLQTMMPKA